jgi:predicted nuclease of predicted toxin-antitoxin system
VTKRVLLDEGVPRHLAKPLEASGISVTPYPNAWKQITNGELLALAERQGFEVLVTNDKNIGSQQNLRGRNISIIVLPTNLRRQVMELAPQVVNAILQIHPGQYIIVEPDTARTRK